MSYTIDINTTWEVGSSTTVLEAVVEVGKRHEHAEWSWSVYSMRLGDVDVPEDSHLWKALEVDVIEEARWKEGDER